MNPKRTLPPLAGVLLASALGAAALPAAALAQDGGPRGYVRGYEIDLYGRGDFVRGYRQGRDDERMGGQGRSRSSGQTSSGQMSSGQEMPGGDADARGEGRSSRDRSAASGPTREDAALYILLVERGQQQQAMAQLRQHVEDAREALKAGDTARADAALERADKAAKGQDRGEQAKTKLEDAIREADEAFDKGDRAAVIAALREAEKALDAGALRDDATKPAQGVSSPGASSAQGSAATGTSSQAAPGNAAPSAAPQGGSAAGTKPAPKP